MSHLVLYNIVKLFYTILIVYGMNKDDKIQKNPIIIDGKDDSDSTSHKKIKPCLFKILTKMVQMAKLVLHKMQWHIVCQLRR